eukprot:2356614-Rhodomonas_salina.9
MTNADAMVGITLLSSAAEIKTPARVSVATKYSVIDPKVRSTKKYHRKNTLQNGKKPRHVGGGKTAEYSQVHKELDAQFPTHAWGLDCQENLLERLERLQNREAELEADVKRNRQTRDKSKLRRLFIEYKSVKRDVAVTENTLWTVERQLQLFERSDLDNLIITTLQSSCVALRDVSSETNIAREVEDLTETLQHRMQEVNEVNETVSQALYKGLEVSNSNPFLNSPPPPYTTPPLVETLTKPCVVGMCSSQDDVSNLDQELEDFFASEDTDERTTGTDRLNTMPLTTNHTTLSIQSRREQDAQVVNDRSRKDSAPIVETMGAVVENDDENECNQPLEDTPLLPVLVQQ